MNQMLPAYGFDPVKLERENRKHYIGISAEDEKSMLSALGLKDLSDLYSHIPKSDQFQSFHAIAPGQDRDLVAKNVFSLSEKNLKLDSFAGDGLQAFAVSPVIGTICGIRELTTAYTPYQPERSQGTLMTLWIYQSALSTLTGFEAINASMWDRSTCAFEAIQTALRLKRQKNVALVSAGLFPGDLEVLHTLAAGTKLILREIPINPDTGITDQDALKQILTDIGKDSACFLFPQTNCLGNLEEVDVLTDLAHSYDLSVIACIDPILYGQGGLKPPTEFGTKGADMIVGEGQHLAIGPNFGGPGLGIFGIRFNDEQKNAIRSTAGRYVGAAKDGHGEDCKVMVLSTREQHIRKEKATSNICSNQSFVATLAGAGILARGSEGLKSLAASLPARARDLARRLCSFPGVRLAFPRSTFFHEICLSLPGPVSELISFAMTKNILAGVDVSSREKEGKRNLLLLTVTDLQGENEFLRLEQVFSSLYGQKQSEVHLADVPPRFLSQRPLVLPDTSEEEIVSYYQKLGTLNLSPDKGLYPLGSCTMKYNPYLNDWAASLPGFTQSHPQAPSEAVQGNLELLYRIQELFKEITGLPGVTTQPVAGAQGELVGLKLFQAYHRDHSTSKRDVILLPRSAHGTNFATATVAGYESNSDAGIQLIEAEANGCISMDHLRELLQKFKSRIAGIMITNPNTCGLSETRFREVADLVHADGGLVYMDGANMNAIAGWLNLGAIGVDAVHQNLHKTWSIPHGGGGPGDCVVAVSEKLIPYLPGIQVVKKGQSYHMVKPDKSVGSFHRHFGNFAHKVRCYTYLLALGADGIRRMSAAAVLSARYLLHRLKSHFPTLPEDQSQPRMHEFILTLSEEAFASLQSAGVSHAQAISRVGKLFLDFGLHAPTVAWPETYGLMIEPTESFTKAELDRFSEVVLAIHHIINHHPHVLNTVPHFTPVTRIDDVSANKNLVLHESLDTLPKLLKNPIDPDLLLSLPVSEVMERILKAASPVPVQASISGA